jgi:hypothetical protein
MRINTRLDRQISIDGQQLEEVNEFMYLGFKETTEGGAREDIKGRLLFFRRPEMHFYH